MSDGPIEVAAPAYAAPIRGPALGRWQRTLATVIVLVVIAGLLRLEFGAPVDAPADVASGPIAFTGVGLAAALLMLAGYWLLMTDVTTIDADGIVQTGFPERRVRWEEVQWATRGRVLLVPSTWRLRVRTKRGRRVVFAGGTPALREAFDRIAAAFPPPTA